MKRRDFLKGSGIASIAAVACSAKAADIPASAVSAPVKADTAPVCKFTTPPVLFNPAETSMQVSAGISSLGNGFADVCKGAWDESKAVRYWSGGFRIRDCNSTHVSVSMTGLEPGCAYTYRVGVIPMLRKSGYNIKLGAPEYLPIGSFTTAGKNASSDFAVFGDTHGYSGIIGAIAKKLDELKPSVCVWNGDIGNSQETPEAVSNMMLRAAGDVPWFKDRPFHFVNGNHDYRGVAARFIEEVTPFRRPEERDPEFWDLGRNFAVRQGDIALIGLDTGEDKPDLRPSFYGIINCEPYRKMQTKWLEKVLQREDIASAPFIVAFSHIPLYPTYSGANPGGRVYADSSDFAGWEKSCADMWAPLLNKARCQLVCCAHTHTPTFHPAEGERSWAMMVTGGPRRSNPLNDVICGKVIDGKLRVTRHRTRSNQTFEEDVHWFEPRKA